MISSSGQKANQIFISYQRESSADVTGRIFDRLVQRFGKDAIFKDIDSIPLGLDFRKHIDSVVQECGVLLVVIGDKWLTAADELGNRRIDDARNFVRIEIEAALQRSIPVIPLLVHNATLPQEESLPPSIKELAYRQALTIGSDPHFHVDMDRLIGYLDSYFLTLARNKEVRTTPSGSTLQEQHQVFSPLEASESIELPLQMSGGISSRGPSRSQPKAPSYPRALAWHILGLGLFYVDNTTKRKWIYPMLTLYALLDAYLAEFGVRPFKDTFGLVTFVAALALYALSFLDIILTAKRRRANA